MELCLRLARFKKENKELLTYLLFEAEDLDGYIRSVKSAMDAEFNAVNTRQLYQAKKTLRKIQRITNRYIRYSGEPQVEVELLIYFCEMMKSSGVPFHKSNVLQNLYDNQLKKIQAGIEAMHEDLRFEYERSLLILQS